MLGGHAVPLGGLGGALRPLRRGFNLASRTFQRHPFLIKTVTSGIGFAFGDALTQLGTRKPGTKYDWPRTAKMAAAGWVVAGPVGFAFLVWLERLVPGTSRMALTTKVTLDQVLGCALWHAALMAVHEPYRKAAAGLVDNCKQALQPRRAHLL